MSQESVFIYLDEKTRFYYFAAAHNGQRPFIRISLGLAPYPGQNYNVTPPREHKPKNPFNGSEL
jgi:hypothetical protein